MKELIVFIVFLLLLKLAGPVVSGVFFIIGALFTRGLSLRADGKGEADA